MSCNDEGRPLSDVLEISWFVLSSWMRAKPNYKDALAEPAIQAHNQINKLLPRVLDALRVLEELGSDLFVDRS